jgi:hypothetical protein
VLLVLLLVEYGYYFSPTLLKPRRLVSPPTQHSSIELSHQFAGFDYDCSLRLPFVLCCSMVHPSAIIHNIFTFMLVYAGFTG